MATKQKRPQAPARRPEKKFGPFNDGIGIAVWLNDVETEQGIRYFRSITISPRRFFDPKDRTWKDAKSFRPADLAMLSLALDAARLYCSSTPLPGQPLDGDEITDMHVLPDGEIVGNGQPGA